MKTVLGIVVAMYVLQLCAAEANLPDREAFFGTDDVVYYLRPATEGDIENPQLEISESIKQDRKDRARNNYYGVFVIEDEEGCYRGRLLTGRMPLAVKPWDSDSEPRLKIIVDFYDWILSLHELNTEHYEICEGAESIMLVNNACHAATAVIASPFATTLIVDALARLTSRTKHKVAPNENTVEGEPFVIISLSQLEPECPEGTISRVFQMPYFMGKKGMRFTTVTSLQGRSIPELPPCISTPLTDYVTGLQ